MDWHGGLDQRAPSQLSRPPVSPPRVGTSVFARLSTSRAWITVIGGSALLGLVCSRSPALATLHQVGVLGAVGLLGLFARRAEPVLAATVYAGTCDVFWRSASARGPWEGAKYALVLGFACLAVRFVRRPRNLGLTVGLVSALIPGAVLGTTVLGLAEAREYLVSNLAGLAALALGFLACSNMRLTAAQVRGVYLVAMSPAVSMAAVAAIGVSSAEDLSFGTASNSTAAGGFGPVQVSSVLCFGGLLCILVLMQRGITWRLRMIALATGAWMVGQAFLTFSRGGIFSLVLAAACAALASLTVSGHRGRTLVVAGLLVVVGLQILSWVGAFTDGASQARFSSTDTTNRTTLARADADLFLDNPVFGVGVGVAKFERDFPVESAPHTEYSRLLAEHGSLGLLALLVLVAMAARAVRASSGWFRLAAVGLVVMSLAQMAHSATRIGCIALGYALAALREQRR